MKTSSQLSDVLHVLIHLAQSPTTLTSETLSAAMNTNPVVLRRLMAGLRDAGLVTSGKGHGGGWGIAVPLENITLRDVHLALGAPALVSLGFREDRPECLVAQVVNGSLKASIQQAEAALLSQLARITLADLFQGVQQRLTTDKSHDFLSSHLLKDHHVQN